MANLIVHSLLIQGDDTARDAVLAALRADATVGDPASYPTSAGTEVVFHTTWEPREGEWLATLSQAHPTVTLTLGWEGETGSDVGWRRYVAGELVGQEDLDFMSWVTPEEWQDQSRLMLARGGITCLLED